MKKTLLNFVLILGVNFLFLYSSKYLGVGRPYLNLDIFICSVILSFGLKKTFVTFFSIIFLAEILSIISQVFPFFSLDDLYYLSGYLLEGPVLYIYCFFMAFLVLIAFLYFFVLFVGSGNKKSALVILNLSVFGIVISNIFFVDNNNYKKQDSRLVSSVSAYLITYRLTGFSDFLSVKENRLDSYSGFSGFDHLRKVADKVILVVNESWGVALNPEINDDIVSLFKVKHFTDFDVIAFSGATVSAELRELCNQLPKNFNISVVDSNFDNCIPKRLKAQGYESMAMHGAAGSMYARRKWYPKLGFDQILFFESMSLTRRCNSFPGACDADLFSYADDFLNNGNEKKFLYWLTLNTHHDYDLNDLDGDHFDCEKFLVNGDSACRNMKLQKQFFYNLSLFLKKNNDVTVVVVGDHEPRILDDSEPDFTVGKIPLLVIRPKLKNPND